MTPRLFIEPDARAEIQEAVTWYEARSAGLGREFLRAVRAALAAIERNPEQFPKVHADIRRVMLRRFPYALYYVTEPAPIAVIACTHHRRHPRRWQSRR